MATSQMIRPEEKTGTWASMFPVEQVTEQQSALFAKKLLAVAISNITYLRAIFPERAYGDRRLGDLNLKILRDDSSCPGASQVIKWVKGCFDALDKKYLRMLLIGIYVDPDDPQTVIESYTFKFSYSTQCGVDIYRNGKKITSAHSTDQTKKETIQLLRTIIVLTQSLQPLPDNVLMTMKILYYDEVTPVDYEPPGFKASNCDSFQFEDEPVNIKLGDVATPFHNVKMRIKTDKKQFDFKDEGSSDTTVGQPISNSGLDIEQDGLSQQAEDLLPSQQGGGGDAPECRNSTDSGAQLQEATVPDTSPAKPEGGKTAVEADKAAKEEEFRVSCPCGCNEDDGLMIVCDVCCQWQHAVCFCILDEEHAPEEHVCDSCAKADNSRKPTDSYLKELNSIAVQATCLWRRTLTVVVEFSRLLPHQLASRLGVDANVAQGLVKRLEKEGFVLSPTKDKRLGKVVLKHKIEKEGIPAYFRPPKKSDDLQSKNSHKEEEDVPMDVSEKNSEMDQQSDTTDLDKPASNKNSDVYKKLCDVTEQAGNISIHSHQLRSSSAKRKTGLSGLKTKTGDTEKKSSSNKENSKARGQKRAYSKVDQTEFELSNSQEMPATRSTRRKKCSDVHKSIMV